MERVRRFFGFGDQATLPALNPNVTQRYVTDKYKAERHNVSGEYVYGLNNSKTRLSFEQYIDLLKGFGKLAITMDRTPELPTYEELEELVEILDVTQFEEHGL